MFDYEIHFALACTPAAVRVRLTKILCSLSSRDIEKVNENVRQAVSRFNYYWNESSGSPGWAATSALVDAIKWVQLAVSEE